MYVPVPVGITFVTWVAVIELETMKVVSRTRGSVASLRALLMNTPMRP